jgi:hypothetical protein
MESFIGIRTDQPLQPLVLLLRFDFHRWLPFLAAMRVQKEISTGTATCSPEVRDFIGGGRGRLGEGKKKTGLAACLRVFAGMGGKRRPDGTG